jgi:AAA domain
VRVDKDVELIKERFHLDHLDYESMSPIIIPQGYTKDYVDGKISFETQLRDLKAAMESVSEASDVTVCEGTGHCAVGSIVGLNNAKVASILGADMVCTS